jgi:CRP-like cAMP-binding protein
LRRFVLLEAPMPVTAKLSRGFYEKLGDTVANELVDLLNTVDANSRSELRELNELNFARFDAKVEQRFAEQDARIDRRFAEAESRLTRWMFAYWTTTMVAQAGILYAVMRAR